MYIICLCVLYVYVSPKKIHTKIPAGEWTEDNFYFYSISLKFLKCL